MVRAGLIQPDSNLKGVAGRTMAKKSNWLLGCGLGCVGILAVIAVIVVIGIVLLRGTRTSFEAADVTRKNLETKLGAPGDFVPAPDGSIPAERLETFLAVRQATQKYRSDIIGFYSALPVDEDAGRAPDSEPLRDRVGSIFYRMRSAIGMGEDLGHLFEARNQELLDRGMGLGEYTYIYVLAYYSWLGHSPGDGPGRNADTSYVMVRAHSRLHGDLIRMLSNQLSSIAEGKDTGEWKQWRSDLAAEIEEMKNNEERVPWQDSLPRKIAESFEPFRDRLERTYSPVTNPFELSMSGRRGLFGFNAR
jgi:hypothetical protein